jgi:hypothetical protein
MYPSYINKIWPIDVIAKPLRIPRGRLRVPVTRIISKIIIPILSSDTNSIEKVYTGKIGPFQDYWVKLIQSTSKARLVKPNLTYYDRTFTMIKSNPIFARDKEIIMEIAEILKDYEINIHTKFSDRQTFPEEALNDINVNDFLNSLYGSYLALMCFWLAARNQTQNLKIISSIARVSQKLAINLDGYNETLDIMTNPEEMDMMKRAKHWERHNIQNRAK